MNREQLKGRYGNKEVANAYKEIQSRHSYIDFFELIYDKDFHVARNAAWIMTRFNDEELALLSQKRDAMIDFVLTTPYNSTRRLVLNLLERMEYTEENIRTDFLDFCLENMRALDVPPGIQSLCMKTAYKQCLLFPELLEEFMRTLEAMELSYYTPAIKSVYKSIFKKQEKP